MIYLYFGKKGIKRMLKSSSWTGLLLLLKYSKSEDYGERNASSHFVLNQKTNLISFSR